jgi:hypothetical protein
VATYREVGGADTTLLSSLANTCANIPGFVAPAIALLFRKRFDSWTLSFAWPAASLLLACWAYWQTASLETARATLMRRKREQQPA